MLTTSVLIALACTACGVNGDAAASPTTTKDPAPSNVWLLDGDGDPDTGDVPLTFTDPHELAAEAVSFVGAQGAAASPGPGPVETTESFTVAAWVSLAPSAVAGGTEFVDAVSQLGDEAAAFYLGVAEGNWAFSMKDADTNEPGHTTRALAGSATPDEQAWVHLTGVHDTEEGEIRLYLDGQPAAETAFTDPWQAGGPLTVGRSQAHAAAEGFWPGAIADVRIYPTALSDRDVRVLADRTAPADPPPSQPSVAPSPIPNGTFTYTFTPEEAAEVISGGFSPEEAAEAGYPAIVSTLLRFEGTQWQLSFAFNGVEYLVDGQPEGDGGTFSVDGERLVLSNPHPLAYRWSLAGDVLTLTLEDEPADADMVRLVTEHEYTLIPE